MLRKGGGGRGAVSWSAKLLDSSSPLNVSVWQLGGAGAGKLSGLWRPLLPINKRGAGPTLSSFPLFCVTPDCPSHICHLLTAVTNIHQFHSVHQHIFIYIENQSLVKSLIDDSCFEASLSIPFVGFQGLLSSRPGKRTTLQQRRGYHLLFLVI